MGYGAGTLSWVLSVLPDGGSILELGQQQFWCEGFPRGAYAKEVYEANGYRHTSVDLQGGGGSVKVDLNVDRSGFRVDVVTNFGTSEHCFDQANVFRYMHESCTEGGWMLHQVPLDWQGHGFFNYDMKLFNALAYANGYECGFPDLESNVDPSGKRNLAVEFRKVREAPFVFPYDGRYSY